MLRLLLPPSCEAESLLRCPGSYEPKLLDAAPDDLEVVRRGAVVQPRGDVGYNNSVMVIQCPQSGTEGTVDVGVSVEIDDLLEAPAQADAPRQRP